MRRLYTDVDQTIREGAYSLDRLIRDIVMEQRDFDFAALPGSEAEECLSCRPRCIRCMLKVWKWNNFLCHYDTKADSLDYLQNPYSQSKRTSATFGSAILPGSLA